MSDRRTVHTSRAPDALGPYSQAIVGAGLVHCSGQIAIDPASGDLVQGDVTAQAEQALANLRAVLEAAGSGVEFVLKCNVYLADMGDFSAVNEVYARTFSGDAPPARACIEARLPKGARIEIDCVALAR
ncbi:MAG TPA: Rid family detoxifying hydrolase [Planctomycetota bacterium]|jgi:2-iminobutanoate/2-iminopropanoate deaminase|nr:Rid family detoxifying hydrolase [Planctomycetota bacterium]